MVEAAVAETKNGATIATIFGTIGKRLEQFVPADVTYCEIGPHENIQDAVNWLYKQGVRVLV